MLRGNLQPWGVAGHYEGAYAPVSLGAVLGSKDDDGAGNLGVGDEMLGAIQEVVAFPLGGSGLERGGVGTPSRFGQRPGGHTLPRSQGRYQALALLVVGEPIDGGGAQGQVGNEAGAGSHVAPGDALGDDGYLAIPAVAAAVLGVNAHAGQAQVRHTFPVFPGELLLLVHLPGAGGQFPVSEVPHQVFQHPFLFGHGHVGH